MISQRLFQLEKDIAELLLTKLEHEEITLERAAEISKCVLHALPDNLTDEQIDSILPKLDDQFIELAIVVHKYLKEKEEKQKDQVASQAELLMHQGRIEDALKIMHEHISKKL